MRQSSADEAGPGRPDASAGDRRDEREQSVLLYAGLAGAALLTAGLWIIRALLARASALELTAGVMVLVGVAVVLSVLTALRLLTTRVDRASEEVSRALDAVAAGKLTSRFNAPRGLGREARLAGAAKAALDRLRSWVDALHSTVATVENDLDATLTTLPRLREAVGATSSHIQHLTRDSRFLAVGAEEQAGLTQRACVLASVIGQSHRDTAAFAERIHSAVRDAAATLADCADRTTELRALVTKQQEETARCLEADGHLAEYLVVVMKSARQFKLLALHAAMEAARAGARSQMQGTADDAQTGGAEFRVVALEVRRLALDLARTTEEIGRTMDTSRRSLQALQAAATEGGRHADGAQGAISLGVSAIEHATAAASARRTDDATLAEAGTELTILTSAIRERGTGAAKATGDLADRLATLDQALAAAEAAARDIEHALRAVGTSAQRTRETIGTMQTTTSVAAPAAAPSRPAPTSRKKRGQGGRPIAPPVGAQA